MTFLTQPPGQICTLTGGKGTVTGDVSNVAVTCTAKDYTIGGDLQGLGAGKAVTLRDNGGDDSMLTSSGPFRFSTALPSGSMYQATVSVQPSGQTCTVTNGSGTGTRANVSSIVVMCR